jgi:hypothetical protein
VDEARIAGGNIRSPQRKLWVQVDDGNQACEAGGIIWWWRFRNHMSPRWGLNSLIATSPTAGAVGYGYFVGFANWSTEIRSRSSPTVCQTEEGYQKRKERNRINRFLSFQAKQL